MKVSFDDFEFNCEQLTLKNNGNKFSIKEKHAQILAILIKEPEKIHSKSDLLSKVWPDETVSDQMVFQSIGHLRALFGDNAVKTFSKKGYQWQIPLSLSHQTSETTKASSECHKKINDQDDTDMLYQTKQPSALERMSSFWKKLF
jgi:DNA-binding winged helix-turn-helix (wHTH) protein